MGARDIDDGGGDQVEHRLHRAALGEQVRRPGLDEIDEERIREQVHGERRRVPRVLEGAPADVGVLVEERVREARRAAEGREDQRVDAGLADARVLVAERGGDRADRLVALPAAERTDDGGPNARGPGAAVREQPREERRPLHDRPSRELLQRPLRVRIELRLIEPTVEIEVLHGSRARDGTAGVGGGSG